MTFGWPEVRIGDVTEAVDRSEVPAPGQIYRQIGVRLWGGGAYERSQLNGSQTQYARLNRVEDGDIIVNKIWARNGSVAVVPQVLKDCYCSGEFPLFRPKTDRLEPRWFHWITKSRWFWQRCDAQSRGTSGKNRIRPERFLAILIPLPPLSDQQRIVARIDELASKIKETHCLQKKVQIGLRGVLLGAYTEITRDASWIPMAEIAPLRRRPVQVEPLETYHEIGIKSFGRGTFHKPSIEGASLGTKRIFKIEVNDLLFNIVFAWEGAVAVAKPQDHGRVGSHRFLTCVPKEGLASSVFFCFHFLTDRGLDHLGKASPGGAGRNRTLGLKALEEIPVPVPMIKKQLWFDSLVAKVDSLQQLQVETAAELDALLPSILDRAFKGEL